MSPSKTVAVALLCLLFLANTDPGRLCIDGFRFEKGCAVKLRSTDNGDVVCGRLVGMNITDCKQVPSL
jgi:hypothetical protein